jgi:hypothetical protein
MSSPSDLPDLPDLSDLSTYPIAELLRRWKLGELSAEQAAGYLIQHLAVLSPQVAGLERRLRRCEERLNGQP